MAELGRTLAFAFFDIGGTLGNVDDAGRFAAFASSEPLLKVFRDTLGLRIGVITNLPPEMNSARVKKLLDQAGLGAFLDPQGLVTNHDAQADKPDPRIFRFAAERVGLAIERCLYVGEDETE